LKDLQVLDQFLALNFLKVNPTKRNIMSFVLLVPMASQSLVLNKKDLFCLSCHTENQCEAGKKRDLALLSFF
jgi:hypothetical protein